LRLTQEEFAGQLGVKRSLLASYEEARAPLRWEFALRACQQFQINEEWLATGAYWGMPRAFENGFQRLTVFVSSDSVFRKVPPRALWSEVFDDYLIKEIPKHFFDGSLIYGRFRFRKTDSLALIKNRVVWFIEHLNDMLAQDQRKRFYKWLMASAHLLYAELDRYSKAELEAPTDFELSIREAMVRFDARFRPRPGASGARANVLDEKKPLTEHSQYENIGGVKSPMKVLLGRVALATKARGKKAALAKFLKVDPPRVSDWLRGRYEPSGEVALRLLEWVEAEEAQQKTPGGAQDAAKGKTRSIHSKDETNKSGPIKS
jgi:transcriptional regulator with XRE-family HTH domain